jgi:hypothetical protein
MSIWESDKRSQIWELDADLFNFEELYRNKYLFIGACLYDLITLCSGWQIINKGISYIIITMKCQFKQWWSIKRCTKLWNLTICYPPNYWRDKWNKNYTTGSIYARNDGVIHRPVPSHWQTLSHNVVSSTPRHERALSSQRKSTTASGVTWRSRYMIITPSLYFKAHNEMHAP